MKKKRAFLVVLMQLVILTSGLAQSSPLSEKEDKIICYFPADPYILNNGKLFEPVSLPNTLKDKKIYGRVFMQISIDTMTNKVQDVYVLRTMLKNNADGSPYLDYMYSDDFDKVDTYPERLKELYPFLKQLAKGIKIERNKDVDVMSRFVTYTVPVTIEKK
ncbi:hypothetical protein GCM10027443_12200 [Pontibacter brevis]